MLTFESPFYEIAGIVIFRDHAVPTLFHYLAGPPRLARDEQGRPHMLLLKYRHALDSMGGADTVAREQLGGGFLLLEVECGLARDPRRDDDVRNEIVQKLASTTSVDSGKISLVPVLYTEGKVNVLALDAQQPAEGTPAGDAEAHKRFVRGIQGTSTPSLLDDQRAIFSISLTPDAVTLIEEAYRSELSPIGVMYELEFAGLRPALAVKAHVEKKKVYEFFKAGLHLGVHS
ncbi:MAG TPA: hypothetical protein VEL74_03650, partial [Thermoanaerobaculia bacterium]|nr:hypothetical protein [Thermoanaerobaculia bacterium]